MNRPLRSVMICDNVYPSEYIFAVNQGMTLLEHMHGWTSIRQDVGEIAKKLNEFQPDVIWGHCLFWGGPSERAIRMHTLCAEWKRRGAKILLHDGDAKAEARYPNDLSNAVDLALCNHTYDRSVWRVPSMRWPYCAFYQHDIADPVPEWACDLFFAGRHGGGIYQQRTEMLSELAQRMGAAFKFVISPPEINTLYRTPEIAASATAVLGYGRQDASGWTDVRVFTYAGAGAVLIHDQAEEFLLPNVHYIPYQRHDVDSIIRAVEVAKQRGPEIRRQAFLHVQTHHSSTVRVTQALHAVGLLG